jgi:integrase
MAKRFDKLTRPLMRKLQAGSKISEHGIVYEKLPDGDGRFTVNIMVDGQRVHRVIGKESEGVTRQNAEDFIEKARTDARAGRLNLPKGKKLYPCFQQVAQDYEERLKLEGGKDLKAKKHRIRDHLKPFFKDTSINKISTSDIERYKKQRLEAGAKPGTINRELRTLSHIYTMAIEWGWIEGRPFTIKALREDNRRTTFLTAEQCERLLREAKEEGAAIYLFCLIALHTGMRRLEILSIRLADINTDNHTITIPKAKAGRREQPITPFLANVLRQHKAGAQSDQVWLFPSDRAKSGHMTAIEKPFRRVVVAAELDVSLVNRHSLRHTAISQLIQAEVDLSTVMRISGHSNLSVVQRYAHQDGKHVHKAMDRLENRYNVPKKPEKDPDAITQELHKMLKKHVFNNTKTLGRVEPMAGLEPATYGLRNRCSTD